MAHNLIDDTEPGLASQDLRTNIIGLQPNMFLQPSCSQDTTPHEDDAEEVVPLLSLSSSCPDLNLQTDSPHHSKEEARLLHRPSGSQTVQSSMHNARAYVEDSMYTAKQQLHHALESVDRLAHKVWDGRWRVVPHLQLPEWQKDNDFLHHWHRPPMPSFKACFGSIFRLHSETGNIWTHLIGFVMFLGICVYFQCLDGRYFVIEWQEKMVFTIFFVGAILCLCFSTLFHTVGCHSEKVYRIFVKLDYSGIALMIMGSFVPWIYYTFYCDTQPKIVYMSTICVLGCLCIVVSQWDKFSTTRFRKLRTVMFAGLGLSGLVPFVHTIIKLGFFDAVYIGQIGWLALMAFLYLLGAFLYAQRIPERYFPGKCDLWFQSHQIFHILVVLAAVVHFHGVSNLQHFRFQDGDQCIAQH